MRIGKSRFHLDDNADQQIKFDTFEDESVHANLTWVTTLIKNAQGARAPVVTALTSSAFLRASSCTLISASLLSSSSRSLLRCSYKGHITLTKKHKKVYVNYFSLLVFLAGLSNFKKISVFTNCMYVIFAYLFILMNKYTYSFFTESLNFLLFFLAFLFPLLFKLGYFLCHLLSLPPGCFL